MPAPPLTAEPDADAALAALRDRGAQALDPVRFRYLEALARRAAQHHGAVRRLLVERLEHAAPALAERAEAASPRAASASAPREAGALVALVAALDLDASARGEAGAPAAELRTARRFRSTWARLRIEHQLTRSQASVPANPGPLNSQRLVLRALRQMQDISPAYLARFMGHVEALMWLGQASVAAAPPRLNATAARPRRSGRGQGA